MNDQKISSKRRPTIGLDPLDALIPMTRMDSSPELAIVKETNTPPLAAKAPRVKHVRATFHIPEALLEEARDAVVHLSGPPSHLTLAQLAEDALRRELQRLKLEQNDGKDFPRRRVNPRGGRPIGS